jgi:hypothetical protein
MKWGTAPRQRLRRSPTHLPCRRTHCLRAGKMSGASRDRTDDLHGATVALSQLSYSPKSGYLTDSSPADPIASSMTMSSRPIPQARRSEILNS